MVVVRNVLENESNNLFFSSSENALRVNNYKENVPNQQLYMSRGFQVY